MRWAARHAELTGAELHAVMAWSLSEIYGYVPRDFADETREALAAHRTEVVGERAISTVTPPMSGRGPSPSFASRAELDAIAAELSPMCAPLPVFAAATGLRPEE